MDAHVLDKFYIEIELVHGSNITVPWKSKGKFHTEKQYLSIWLYQRTVIIIYVVLEKLSSTVTCDKIVSLLVRR